MLRVQLVALVGLAALVATGCGADGVFDPVEGIVHDACQPLVLVPEGNLSDDERRGVLMALAMWNDSAGARLALDGAPESARLSVVFERAAGAFHGVYDSESGTIYVNHTLRDEQRVGVTLAHEIGHAFGLAHVPSDERRSLMNPGNTTVEITAGDVGALVARWGNCELSPRPSP